MPTKRQIITELLTNGIYTLQELSTETHISMAEVRDHLDHVRKSVRAPRKFIIEPAKCLGCGFVFKDRSKIHTPGKCPKCRSSHIHESSYRIENTP
jgi:predicted Zn-ribbon and HTH transcriptional regulator